MCLFLTCSSFVRSLFVNHASHNLISISQLFLHDWGYLFLFLFLFFKHFSLFFLFPFCFSYFFFESFDFFYLFFFFWIIINRKKVLKSIVKLFQAHVSYNNRNKDNQINNRNNNNHKCEKN